MAMSEVSRSEIIKLLGLPPDADDETVLRAVDDMVASQQATALPLSVAEKQARAEDRRTVLAAVNDGRIVPDRLDFWCQAMQKDRAGNRAVLASLASGLTCAAAGTRTPDTGDDAEMAGVYAKVTGAPLDQARRPRATRGVCPPAPVVAGSGRL